jgi:DNA-binding transcriptional MerR regulator
LLDDSRSAAWRHAPPWLSVRLSHLSSRSEGTATDPEEKLITIGELADRVGITIRTLQYYDQAGILKPSAKGSRNQRLYSAGDVEELYRILCMKFMGIPLDEIKNDHDCYRTIASVQELFRAKTNAMEEEFNELLKRFTALKNLATTTRDDIRIDWSRYAGIIEDFEDGGKYFWQLSCVYEEDASRDLEHDLYSAEQRGEEARRKQSFRDWHELIADSIVFMHDDIPADDPCVRPIAQRYIELHERYGQFPPEKHFILRDGHMQEDHAHAAFGDLRNDVYAYLEKAAQAITDDE